MLTVTFTHTQKKAGHKKWWYPSHRQKIAPPLTVARGSKYFPRINGNVLSINIWQETESLEFTSSSKHFQCFVPQMAYLLYFQVATSRPPQDCCSPASFTYLPMWKVQNKFPKLPRLRMIIDFLTSSHRSKLNAVDRSSNKPAKILRTYNFKNTATLTPFFESPTHIIGLKQISSGS